MITHCVSSTQIQHTNLLFQQCNHRKQVVETRFNSAGRVLDSTGGLALKEVPKNLLLSVVVSSVLN